MASEKVEKLAKDIQALSPQGQQLVGAVLSGDISGMLNLEELIKNHVDSIDKLSDEIKEAREMFQDSYLNNPSYRERQEQVKEATKARNSVKNEICKQPSVATLEQKLKDLRFDKREKQKTLSDLLLDYKEQTGAEQLELFNGLVVDIVQSAKIVRKR